VVADLDCFLQRGRRAAGAGAGGDVLRVHDAVLDLLQNNMNRGREEVRLDKVKGIEERGRAGVHWRRRNQPEIPAGMRGSGEEFCSPRCGSSGEAKGERERTPGAIYRHGRGEETEGGLIGMKRE
jgi:hypothetical protein